MRNIHLLLTPPFPLPLAANYIRRIDWNCIYILVLFVFYFLFIFTWCVSPSPPLYRCCCFHHHQHHHRHVVSATTAKHPLWDQRCTVMPLPPIIYSFVHLSHCLHWHRHRIGSAGNLLLFLSTKTHMHACNLNFSLSLFLHFYTIIWCD